MKLTRMIRKPLPLAIMAASCALSTSYVTADMALEEVVVTAQKRTQSAQEIPVAIEALSADKLTKSGVSDLSELAKISTGFSLNTATGTNNVSIRGVGSQVNDNTADSIVAVYIDGMFIARSYALSSAVGSLGDVESLQVLKGPQGTLYGRNSTAGAIVIETYTPGVGDDFNGAASVTVGDFGVRQGAIRLSGGLSDTTAASIIYSDKTNDGFVENRAGGEDFDSVDSWSLKGKFVFEPSDTTSFILSANRSEDSNRSFFNQQVSPGTAAFGWAVTLSSLLPLAGVAVDDAGIIPGTPVSATLLGLSAGLTFGNEAGDGTVDIHSPVNVNGFNNAGLIFDDVSDTSTGGIARDTRISLKATFGFDSFDVISVTGYNQFLNASGVDVLKADPGSLPQLDGLAALAAGGAGGPSALPGVTTAQVLDILEQGNIGFSGALDAEMHGQEVYLVSNDSDIEWIIGGSYFNEVQDASVSNILFGLDLPASRVEMETTALSVYGEATIPLTDNLSATVGGRYTEDSNEISGGSGGVNPATGLLTPVNRPKLENEEITYTAKLNYVTDNFMVYGGISTGYKAGTYATGSALQDPSEPEEVTSYEVGFKSDLMDGTVRFNASAFFYDYKNIQLNVLDVGGATSSGATVIANGAAADVAGLEFDVQWLVGDNTMLFTSGTLLDTEFTKDVTVNTTGVVQVITGNSLPTSPDSVIVVGIDQVFPFDAGDVTFNLSANFNSGYFLDQQNTIGTAKDGLTDDGFTTVSTSVTYASSDEVWTARAYINNLTDEEYFVGGFTAGGGLFGLAAAGRQRHGGVTVTYNF